MVALMPFSRALCALLLASVVVAHPAGTRPQMAPTPPAFVLVHWLRPQQSIDGFGAAFPHLATDLMNLAATSEPAPGVYTSAYRDPMASRLVLVAINAAPAARRLDVGVLGEGLTTITPYMTSATQNLASLPAIAASSGFSAVLPASSVTTFVGTDLYQSASLCRGRFACPY